MEEFLNFMSIEKDCILKYNSELWNLQVKNRKKFNKKMKNIFECFLCIFELSLFFQAIDVM